MSTRTIKQMADELSPPPKQPTQPETINLIQARYERHFLTRGMKPAEAKSQAEWWATLKEADLRNGTNIVIDPTLSVDEVIAEWRAQRDGGATITSSYQPSITAQAGSLGGTPPAIMERPNNRYLGANFEIDRFSLNPGRDYYSQALPASAFAGPAPEMFSSGPLPIMTGSGAPPEVLRSVAWILRPSAAFATSRAHVLELIEASQQTLEDQSWAELQNDAGRHHLGVYFQEISIWINTPPDDQRQGLQDLSIEEIERFYPSSPDD
jgi:hypothetical protein